ncbi:MAG: trimethylamine methyltransferase family protein, partial [Rhizobiaceae bacterium]
AQAVAETLAALVQVQLARRGARMPFGNWVFVSDLRTGAFSGGSGEEALLMAGAAQMARYYDLPGSIAAGMTDSKAPDYQAGMEKGLTLALAGLSGGNMVYEAAGMMSSLMATSFEAMVIDNELIGSVQRTLRGIEVDDATLSYDVIADVTLNGPNHFLGHRQTLLRMESEFLYPAVADRRSLALWEAGGRDGIIERARAVVTSVLGTHFPSFAGEEADESLRRRFSLGLPRSAMSAAGTRWNRTPERRRAGADRRSGL